MRYLKYAFLILLAVVLLTVALANRGPVTLQLLPDDLAGLAGGNWMVELPLFIVILGGVLAGLLIGFIWEWLREYRIRSEAARAQRRLSRLEAEMAQIREKGAEPGDDVLALLEDGGRAR
ncbi:LapA family protein [Halodurantibacterium flavum]|uniref:Lipopolysaccharide assembly LapA domain-containing protein n=1 Tax=Halodurantibacterium flavum TaxID=1382802 RepID=A0ABW4S758_9RHOB